MFRYEVDDLTALTMVELRDAESLFALVDDCRSYLREWLPWVDQTRSVDDTRTFLRRALHQHGANDGFQCCIRYDDEVAGVIGLHRVDWANSQTEIGYWLGETFQGRGIMTACCRALVDFAFREYELNRVEIRAAVDNARSRAIPERLGFVHEGTLRQFEWVNGRFLDGAVYAMLNEDWEQGDQR